MTPVITRLCRDCLDTSCIEEESAPSTASTSTWDRLRTGSGTSSTSTPTSASTARRASPSAPGRRPCATPRCPPAFDDDIALNASIVDRKDKFRVPRHTDKPQPTTSDVAANKHKWAGPTEGPIPPGPWPSR